MLNELIYENLLEQFLAHSKHIVINMPPVNYGKVGIGYLA